MNSRKADTVLVASTGGHVKELHELAPRLTLPPGPVVWVTNETIQSRSLLAGQRVLFVPSQWPRNPPTALRNAGRAARILTALRPRCIVSTGAGIALSFLPVGSALGASCHYIESATRVVGPSLSGRILHRVPGVRCYTQHGSWSGRGWEYSGSVFDGFRSAPRWRDQQPIQRVAVVLGTWTQGFRSLIDRLLRILPQDVDTMWQTGFTDVTQTGIEPRPWLSPEDLAAELRRADVVVMHAGMGATLDALEAGHCPVVIPRRKTAGEQVDDHQVELAKELQRRNLAVVRLPEALQWGDLVQAARRRVAVASVEARPPFVLR